jgi:hypothetical protein
MPYIGNQNALAYTSFAKQDFTTSATTSYTLDNPVANENEIALFINFVRQEPTTAYTASGVNLTLTSATSATDDMYCVFLGKALQTVNPPAGSVGLSQLSATGTKDSTTFLRGDNTFAEAGGDNTPSFKASTSSATTIANATYTTITFDGTDVWDTDSAFASNTFTVPSGKGGKYLFCYGTAIANLGDADFSEIILAVNGTNDESTRYREQTGTAQTTIMRASAILNLSAADTVVVKAFHNYGSNRDTTTGQTSFEGMRLIGV